MMALLLSPRPSRAGAFTGGDPCSLLEGLPPTGHPARQGPYKAQFKALDKAGRNARKMLRVHKAFAKKVAKLLAAGAKVFHPGKNKTVKSKRAQRFLEKHVLGPRAALVIADDRFEPPMAVWAAMIWSACRGGRVDVALEQARRAGRTHPSLAAFATLLLLDAGKTVQARHLLPEVAQAGGDYHGFLATFVAAELAKTAPRRRRLHARASRRVSTPDQGEAVRRQAARLAKRRKAPATKRPSKKGGK